VGCKIYPTNCKINIRDFGAYIRGSATGGDAGHVSMYPMRLQGATNLFNIDGYTVDINFVGAKTGGTNGLLLGGNSAILQGIIRHFNILNLLDDASCIGISVISSTTVPDRILIDGCDFSNQVAGSEQYVNAALYDKVFFKNCVWMTYPPAVVSVTPQTGVVSTTTTLAVAGSQATLGPLASTTGFIIGGCIYYTLIGGVVEHNFIKTVNGSTQLILENDIGTNGIDTGVAVVGEGWMYQNKTGTSLSVTVIDGSTQLILENDIGTTGTINEIDLYRGTTTAIPTSMIAGVFRLSPNDRLKVLYTVAPTMKTLQDL